MSWLSRLELRARQRYYITNLMYYIVGGMAVVFLLDLMGFQASNLFYLNMRMVAQGQVWRLLTFIFLPPSQSILWIILSLYFYFLIGNMLESQWGSFRFNLYYLLGVIGAIIAAAITGYADNTYLNMSLFFAFAALYPNFQMMLFFFIPIKMKWLALLNLLFYLDEFIVRSWPARLAILFSLLNLILFFGKDTFIMLRSEVLTLNRRIQFRRQYRR